MFMEIIKIDNLEVKCKDFGQVECGNIYSITEDWQDGWRIPSKEELDLIYDYKIKHGRFENKYYCSSNRLIEDDYLTGAWVKHFGNGRNFHFGELFPAYVLSVKSVNDKECFKNGIVELLCCDRIDLLQYDFGLVDWQEAKNIVKNLGDNWRMPTNHELDLIKPYESKIAGIRSDYYLGVTIQDGMERSTSAYFGGRFQYPDQHNLRNNLFVVRSKKPFIFSIPKGMVII